MTAACLIFDYQDSFTYNIVSELKLLGLESTVIPFEQIAQTYRELQTTKEKKVLIHGPGPGHPEIYRGLFIDLNPLLEMKNFFHLGICLGHQILLTLQGLEIKNSLNPKHGRKSSVILPEWTAFDPSDWGKQLEVQRYNSLSLSVSNLKSNLLRINISPDFQYLADGDDVMMTFHQNKLTYQFHPESVGTTCPFVFFGALKRFLYN